MITPRRMPSAPDVARHYDELDAFYREVWGEHVHHGLWQTGRETPEEAVEALIDRVAREAGLQAGDAVCDVGCGYGATARYLARHYDARVTALTLSEAQYRYARSLTSDGENPAYFLRDWLDNRLSERSFDAVIAIESTEHMADKGRALAEAFRVLRPGGRFVCCAWLATETPAPWTARYLLEPICLEGQLPGLGTATEYRQWLARAGFVLEGFDDLTRQVRRTWPVCLRRVAGRLLSDPVYAGYLLDRTRSQRRFPLTMLRIWTAYLTGAMRYGLFTARRPA